VKKYSLAVIPFMIVLLFAFPVLTGTAPLFTGSLAYAQDETPPAQEPDPEAMLNGLQEILTELYQQANPSVVNITNQGQMLGPGEAGLPQDAPSYFNQGLGSGVVWDDQGHIVTNNHVIENAGRILVSFGEQLTVPAQVIGTDPYTDLAVLRVDVSEDVLVPLPVASSADLQVGQIVIAIGNPFGLQGTMTFGIISALGRSLPVGSGPSGYSIPDIIQTDAPINPGNSGGALINTEGELIGITSAIESPVRANAGIGFAVPSDILQQVVPALIETGAYQHPYLGISGATLTQELAQLAGLAEGTRGVLIVEVTPDSPAAEAGLQGSQFDNNGVPVGGDVLTAIDGQPVSSMDDVVSYLFRTGSVGDEVVLTVLRDGEEQEISVTLGARPGPFPTTGRQPQEQGPVLGIQLRELTPELSEELELPGDVDGVVVVSVVPNSAAELAGFQPEDVIVSFDNESVTSIAEIVELIANAPLGEAFPVVVLRDGEEVELSVTLGGEAPPQEQPEMEPTEPTPTPPALTEPAPTEEPEVLEQGPVLGILPLDLTPQMYEGLQLPEQVDGVVVVAVLPDSPAERAGFLIGDVIVSFNNQMIDELATLRQTLQDAPLGEDIPVMVIRGGEIVELSVTMEAGEEGG
jgi:2-alkenal reductase